MIKQLSQYLLDNHLKISVGESCSGGGLSSALTGIAGSSAYFDRGYITYSNQAKMQMLGVKKNTLDTFGAVSHEVVKEMVIAVKQNSDSDVAIAISGIAGPDGGSLEKPVGTVCFAFGLPSNRSNNIELITVKFNGNRTEITKKSIDFAISHVLALLIT